MSSVWKAISKAFKPKSKSDFIIRKSNDDDTRITVKSNKSNKSSTKRIARSHFSLDTGSGSDTSSNRDTLEAERLASEGVDGVYENIRSPAEELIHRSKEVSRKKNIVQEDTYNTTYHVMFAGIVNSGKTTFVKQLRLGFGTGFTEDEKHLVAHTMFSSLLQLLRVIIETMEVAEGTIYSKLHSLLENDSLLSGDYDYEQKEELKKLSLLVTSEDAFKQAWKTYLTTANYDAAKYLLANSARILALDYVANDTDVIMCRQATMATTEDYVQVSPTEGLHVMDLGGYKYLRKEWDQFFVEPINAVVFVFSLTCYDLASEDDPNMSQFDEALEAFDSIVNQPVLINKPIILLLNKKDVLMEKMKLKHRTMRDYIQNCKEFVRSLFMSRNTTTGRSFHIYITNATDVEQTKAMLKMIVSIAMRSAKEMRQA